MKMEQASKNGIGKLSLCMAIAGVVATVLLAVVMVLLEKLTGTYMPETLCMVLFVSLEIIALVTGIMGWKSVYGKAGLASSVVLLVIAAVLFPVPRGGEITEDSEPPYTESSE